MRSLPKLTPLALVLALLAGCADEPAAPVAPEAGARLAQTVQTPDGEMELKRPKIDVTHWIDETEILPLHLVTPEAARNIGPGSALLITIPGEGRFGCTANFIWKDGSKTYLGSAGHCFVPADKRATHGAGADYDASGVVVQVCVEGCEGNFRSSQLVGKFVTLGQVAYARQTDATGEEQVGHDFGVVEIPTALLPLVRASMPVWGGPTGVKEFAFGAYGCHYGNGLGVGEVFLTKARVGLSGGSDEISWMGDFAGAPGDSGSGIVTCESDGLGFHGKGASGVLTHLGVGTGEVKHKNLKIVAEHGVILGTTMRRSVEMAREAGLNLSVVLP